MKGKEDNEPFYELPALRVFFLVCANAHAAVFKRGTGLISLPERQGGERNVERLSAGLSYASPTRFKTGPFIHKTGREMYVFFFFFSFFSRHDFVNAVTFLRGSLLIS